MEINSQFKPSAFRPFNPRPRSKKHLEDNINDSLLIEDESESFHYDEIGEIIEREFTIDARENSAIKLLTINIVQTYKKCSKDYEFEETMKPRRELTIPSEGVYNESRDNIDFNLIVSVGDEIKGHEYSYIIHDLLGQGISGQVFKCLRAEDQKYYAMKIIKNKKAYNHQALIELKILEFLNKEVDRGDLHHIIRLFDHFYYKEHLCIIFELLNENLFELLKQNYFQGISLNSIQFIIKQILEAIYQLQKADLIHCDLKPENILLKIDKEHHRSDIIIKITDFGSSCFKNNTMFDYIQSRYYRAPEVMIGARYSCEIDIWSIGCIAAELFLGEPLFPGSCEYDQLNKIIKLQGMLPACLLKMGKKSRTFFKKDEITKRCRIKTTEEYYKEFPTEMESKYEIPFDIKSLDDLVTKTNHKTNLNASSSENNNDAECFVHFIRGLLNVNPYMRWNAKQALRHPFITKEKFDGYFNPNVEEISQLLFHSNIDGSYISDYHHMDSLKNNPNLCHTMMINVNPISDSVSCDQSNYSCTSIDMSVYQPNMKNIPLKLLKNFPFAKIDGINLKPGKKDGNAKGNGKGKGKNNNKNKFNNCNNTFMKTSHDELNVGNSFTTDNKYNGPWKRQFKDDMNSNLKNKYSNAYNQHGNGSFINNNTHHLNFNLINNQSSQPTLQIENTHKRNSNELRMNKSLFAKDKSAFINSKEYEGLISQSNRDINRSFDFNNRVRSKSDYYHQNFNYNNYGNNYYTNNNYLNYSNCSTYPNEKENQQNYKGTTKNLSSLETPIVNARILPKVDDKEINIANREIKEEDQGDEELILNFN